MTQHSSLADRAVAALAAVNRMDYDVTNEDALRHTVRTLKRQAERILMDAFLQAQDLAFAAEDVLKESRKLPKEAT